MFTPLQRTWRFCRGDGSLSLAVGILIVFIFILYPMVEVHAMPRMALDIAFAAAIGFGTVFVFEPRPLVRAFLVALALALTARVVEYFIVAPWLFVAQCVLVFALCALLGVLLLLRVVRDGRINLHRIMGAIGAYLLLGLMFTQAYRLLTRFVPDAFAVGGAPADFAVIGERLVYFSFITLTSTGFGDITPLHPYARSLVTLEALAGSLFLAVLVARLVALEVEWRHQQRETQDKDS